jgi:hypothetical protein
MLSRDALASWIICALLLAQVSCHPSRAVLPKVEASQEPHPARILCALLLGGPTTDALACDYSLLREATLTSANTLVHLDSVPCQPEWDHL